MPKVSVIVPSYNHARYLAHRLDSILAQTFQDFEVLFLDDASSDDTLRVFEKYKDHPKVRAIINPVNSGNTFKQWNKGAREATGEYLWFAESDDACAPTFLQRLVAVLDAHPSAAFAYCHSLFIGDDDTPVGDVSCWVDPVCPRHWKSDYVIAGAEECRRYLVFRNTIPNASAVLVRKSVFDAVGGAEEGMKLSGDWATWIKLAQAGDVVYLAAPLNHWRDMHTNSVRSRTASHRLRLEERLEILKRIVVQSPLDPEVKDRVYEECCELFLTLVRSDDQPLTAFSTALRQAAELDEDLFRSLLSAVAMKTAQTAKAAELAEVQVAQVEASVQRMVTTLVRRMEYLEAEAASARAKLESEVATGRAELDKVFGYLNHKINDLAHRADRLDHNQAQMYPVVHFWGRVRNRLMPPGGLVHRVIRRLKRIKAKLV